MPSSTQSTKSAHDWRTPLLAPGASVGVFKQTDKGPEQTEELPLLQAQQSLPLQAVVTVPISDDAPLAAMCPDKDFLQKAKLKVSAEQCANAEPWRYANSKIFEDLVAHATGGYNVFGRPAYICEILTSSSDVISLNVKVILTSGKVCTMTAYPDIDGPPQFAECKQ